MMRSRILAILFGLFIAQSLPAAVEEEPEMWEYVTCAVYYRMIVGSFSRRYGSGLESMADLNREKMEKAMQLGRQAAIREYGTEMAEEMFQSEWRNILEKMNREINYNYDNISRIKYSYRGRCADLIKPDQ